MPAKNKSVKSAISSRTSQFSDHEESRTPPSYFNITLQTNGDPGPGDYMFMALFNESPFLEGKWQDGLLFENSPLCINLNEYDGKALVASQPIIFLLRAHGGKVMKQDPDHLLHPDNKGGATFDLLPIILGAEEILTTVHLVSITTGELIGCQIAVRVTAPGLKEHKYIPLLITMLAIHCVPQARDGTVYISAIGLNGTHTPKAINFGQSLSTPNAPNITWATASNAGPCGYTAMRMPEEDTFIPEELDPKNNEGCRSFYWNALNRVLIESEELKELLTSKFLIDIAGVPRAGKVDLRGRYMGWVDARILLEAGQLDVTVAVRLSHYNEAQTHHVGGGLLDVPPTSAKQSARDSEIVCDEFEHDAYAVIRFDLTEALVPKPKLISLYDIIGFPIQEGPAAPVHYLDTETVPDEPFVDARLIKKEGGALAVHKELSNLACRGDVPMNQGIKRSAANRLLVRIRTMLKNFPPGDCSYIDWQDTVTGQHAASRLAVNSSFAPQAPQPRPPERVAAARCRVAGDERLVEKHTRTNLKVAGRHPRSLICKTLRCLEERNEIDAKNYLFEALSSQVRNRYLLLILGAQEYDKGPEAEEVARAAFRIAVKGDTSDGTTNAIAWAALHTFYHYSGNIYGAYIAAKKMRKFFSLPREWKKVLRCWSDMSGEEEVLWIPKVVTSENPILMAAAFFLCLRCFKFSESLLQCVEMKCATRGSHRVQYKLSSDVYYVRAASFILRQQVDLAMETTKEAVRKFGPTALMSQMRLTCLACTRSWDAECEKAFKEAEKAGAKISPSILYRAALSNFQTNPRLSLQRAVRVHKKAASGHTALLVGRIYAKLGEEGLAERWCAGAVNIEPYLADGWAMLAILAMYQRNVDKARTMLRTARQVGPVSPDLEDDLKIMVEVVKLDQLPDHLVKNLCIKNNYD